MEKNICTLLEEAADEIQQETVRILKQSNQPKGNLSRAAIEALHMLQGNGDLVFLPIDKDNTGYLHHHYVGKISHLVEDSSYRRLAKDPTQSMEWRTMLLLLLLLLLLKKSSIPDDVTEQL